jgi:hypothetical protein
MAKKRIIRTEEEVDDSRPPAADHWSGGPPGEGEMSDAMVQQVLDSVGPGEIKIKISKMTRGGAEYCYSTETIDEDFLQQEFGGGRYACKIFVNDVYRKTFYLNIAQRLTVNAAHGGMADNSTIAFLKEQIQDLRSQLNGGRDRTPIGELAEAMVKIQQLNGGGGIQAQLDILKTGIELGRSGGGSNEKGDDLLSIVREALPIVGTMVKNQRGNTPDNPGIIPAHRTENTLPDKKSDDLIHQGLAYLKRQAFKGADPLLFVDFVAINADDPQYQGLLRFALSSDVSALATYDADIGKPPLSAWFQQFLDGLRQAFAPNDSVEVDSSGESGDSGDTGGNVAPIERGKSKSKTRKTG